ncbi:hypothetical protein HN748_04110 [Candidatus Peregrinibacteria bacterium]|jgi:hypothetical protein|nr:hypothetical protein [Candidatus Peregrinibacteria bacterium]MBT7484647.1 hypothetical protein [Candidatus Peregrinibacteria bacterium]MBT7703394.1 hypothetical protein [Candidatus Peregrinibacteria bacterium]
MQKLLSLLAAGLLIFMLTGCDKEVEPIPIEEDLHGTSDEEIVEEDEIIYADPSSAVMIPTEEQALEEVAQPTTPPPTD